MVAANGDVKIGDFGTARRMVAPNVLLTNGLGTPVCVSPPCMRAADWWGCQMYFSPERVVHSG